MGISTTANANPTHTMCSSNSIKLKHSQCLACLAVIGGGVDSRLRLGGEVHHSEWGALYRVTDFMYGADHCSAS